jgi:DNA-directed RNA polymerase subunit M/transcription elongation factor TFIIS
MSLHQWKIMSEESKCDCQHCGGHIAFQSEAAGQKVECPHCKNETLLSNAQSAASLPQSESSSKSHSHLYLIFALAAVFALVATFT